MSLSHRLRINKPLRRSAMRGYAVAPIQYRGVALRHLGPRDATWVPLPISTWTTNSRWVGAWAAYCIVARVDQDGTAVTRGCHNARVGGSAAAGCGMHELAESTVPF